MSKTILISVNTTWNLYNFRLGLIKALIKNGYHVILLAPIDSYFSKLPKLNCNFKHISIDNKGKNPISDIKLLLDYIYVIWKFKPLAYLGFTIKPNIYGSIAANIFKVPVINNVAGLGTAFVKNSLTKKIATILYKISLKNSSKIFFQNKQDRNIFIKKNIVRINNSAILPGSGVDLKKFDEPILRKQNKDVNFLFFGRLLWAKGVDEYIKAAEIIKHNYDDNIRFIILGIYDIEHPNAVPKDYIDKWQKKGVVEYKQATDDVRKYISTSDCIVLPTYYPEGTPKSLLEGAAMFKPIITTNTNGCRDIVEHGLNGFLCKSRNVNDLVRMIDKFLKLNVTERNKMGKYSREKVVTQFDEEIVINSYINVLKTYNI